MKISLSLGGAEETMTVDASKFSCAELMWGNGASMLRTEVAATSLWHSRGMHMGAGDGVQEHKGTERTCLSFKVLPRLELLNQTRTRRRPAEPLARER
jgi:hypothetical protein